MSGGFAKHNEKQAAQFQLIISVSSMNYLGENFSSEQASVPIPLLSAFTAKGVQCSFLLPLVIWKISMLPFFPIMWWKHPSFS